MRAWKYVLDVKEVFHEDLPFEQKRDEIVGRIKRSSFYDEDNYELAEVVAELGESDDQDSFNSAWMAFYDFADYERVWVKTF